MKKLSVILPTYNSSNFIEKTLKSVLNQTYTNLEIIIIDDCSVDNTVEIIKNIAKSDDRIKLHIFETNKGPGFARNTGIQLATGEYITFMDHDDFQGLDRYEKMITLMEKDGTNACFSNAQDYSVEEGRCIKEKCFEIQTGIVKTSDFIPCPPWAKICKTNIIKDNEIVFASDSLFDDNLFHNLLMSVIDEMSGCPDNSYTHVYFAKNISTKYPEGSMFKNYDILKNFEQALNHKIALQVPKQRIAKGFLEYFDRPNLGKDLNNKIKSLLKKHKIKDTRKNTYFNQVIFNYLKRYPFFFFSKKRRQNLFKMFEIIE